MKGQNESGFGESGSQSQPKDHKEAWKNVISDCTLRETLALSTALIVNRTEIIRIRGVNVTITSVNQTTARSNNHVVWQKYRIM